MKKRNISAREFARQILRFYVPLAIQAASQSLTYPLVGSIVSHGEFGFRGYGAFAQGTMLLFFIGALGNGLITTGMVFARTKSGMAVFARLVARISVVMVAIQIAAFFHPFEGWFFGKILNLEGEYRQIARITMLSGIPMQIAFMIRNIHLVALCNAKESALANRATMIRIAATAALSPIFVHLGLTGHHWGMVAMTIPVYGEMLLTRFYARKTMAALEDKPGDELAPLGTQLRFTIPLSFGGILLSASTLVVAAFLARTKPDPKLVIGIHYMVMGVVNPLHFAALRMQAAVIAFPPAEYGRGRMACFAFAAGAALSLPLLLFQIPAVSRWYFCGVQNLEPSHLRLAMAMALMMAVQPFMQSLRGRAEGLAALRRRPNAILAGQGVYLATMVLSLNFFIGTESVPGHLMGGLAILFAIFATLVTTHIALMLNDFDKNYVKPGRRPEMPQEPG